MIEDLFEQNYWEQNRIREKEERDSGFLKDSAGLNINDFSPQSDAKTRLLIRYFPRRFAKGGKQDISRYEPAQVGALFKKLYDYYAAKKKKS